MIWSGSSLVDQAAQERDKVEQSNYETKAHEPIKPPVTGVVQNVRVHTTVDLTQRKVRCVQDFQVDKQYSKYQSSLPFCKRCCHSFARSPSEEITDDNSKVFYLMSHIVSLFVLAEVQLCDSSNSNIVYIERKRQRVRQTLDVLLTSGQIKICITLSKDI